MNDYDDNSMRLGTVLSGKYRLDELLGVGGMGAVYSSTHLELGRKMAIKTLHQAYVKDKTAWERFRLEARTAASIGHDNICEVFDFGETDDGSPYLVMPVLKGCNFSEFLKNDALPMETLVDIMCQTLSALQAAHSEGIVHRDLKPDNIFITKVGDRQDFVKLLDFGISKIINAGADTELTQTGVVMGTPNYLTPEQVKGSRDIDQRVDIYAIGVIMYKALTGRRPFNGTTNSEIIYKIIYGALPTITSLNPNVPVELEKVVLKAMSRDSANRYLTAEDMRTALKELLPIDNALVCVPEKDAVPMTPDLEDPDLVEDLGAPTVQAGTPLSQDIYSTTERTGVTGGGTGGLPPGEKSGVTGNMPDEGTDTQLAKAGVASNKPIYIAAAMLTVGLIAGVGWYFMNKSSQEEIVEDPAAELDPQPAVADPKPQDNSEQKAASPVAEPAVSEKKAESLSKDESLAETADQDTQPSASEQDSADKKKKKRRARKKKSLTRGKNKSTFITDYDKLAE